MINIFVIAIDSGTTNSRIRLINNKTKECHAVLKLKVGVRNTALDGHNQFLKKKLSQGIMEIINLNKININQIRYIVASGMITSGLGLFEIPHINCPASISKLARLVECVKITGFPDIPCYFIPGVKNNIEMIDEPIGNYDVIRGEEVETFGLMEHLHLKGNGLIILPGSHNKFIFIKEGAIENSVTTISGELLGAISSDTILSSSLNNTLLNEIKLDFLLKGYNDCLNSGLTRALFQVRLLELFNQSTREERANYLVGSIIAEDIKSINKSEFSSLDWILIGGSNPLRTAFSKVIEEMNFCSKVMEATEENVEYSTVIGSLLIIEEYLGNQDKL